MIMWLCGRPMCDTIGGISYDDEVGSDEEKNHESQG